MELSIFILGIVIGCIITNIIYLTKYVGVLRLISEEDDGELYMSLELSKTVKQVSNRRYVLLRVKQTQVKARR